MRKLFENEAKHIKVKVNILGKIMCALLTVWSIATFFLFVLFFINFQRDFPLFVKINLHENGLFEICEALGIECYPYALKTIMIKTVFNILLIITFWMQHVMMSKLSFKLRMVKIFPEYLIIERPMYNLASQLIYFIAFSLWQPIDLVLFNFMNQSTIIDIIGGIGLLIFLKSCYDLHDVADLSGISFMKKVFNSKEITFNTKYLPPDTPGSIRVSRIYKMCRHPMHLGTIIMILVWRKDMEYQQNYLFFGFDCRNQLGHLI